MADVADLASELIRQRPNAPTKPKETQNPLEKAAIDAAEAAFIMAQAAFAANAPAYGWRADYKELEQRLLSVRSTHRKAVDGFLDAITFGVFGSTVADDWLAEATLEYHALTLALFAMTGDTPNAAVLEQITSQRNAVAAWRNASVFDGVSIFGNVGRWLILGAVAVGAILWFRGK
jgi:hypothetical protein